MADLAFGPTSFLLEIKNKANLFTIISGFVVVGTIAYYAILQYRREPLPPGPKGRYPLLGMTFDVPKHHLVSYLCHFARTLLGYLHLG